MSTVSDAYLVGLIGNDITESLSPSMHEREADYRGARYLYRQLAGDAVASGRDHPEVISYGAGTTGALASAANCWPAKLDVPEVRAVLPRQGAIIVDLSETSEKGLHEQPA